LLGQYVSSKNEIRKLSNTLKTSGRMFVQLPRCDAKIHGDAAARLFPAKYNQQLNTKIKPRNAFDDDGSV